MAVVEFLPLKAAKLQSSYSVHAIREKYRIVLESQSSYLDQVIRDGQALLKVATPQSSTSDLSIREEWPPAEATHAKPLTLYEVIRQDDVLRVKLLLAAGADVNIPVNAFGWNPLHVAAAEGHTAIVKVLLEHGADVNAWTFTGYTALEIAADRGRSNVVKVLSQAGAFPALENHGPISNEHEWVMEWQAREYLENEFSLEDDIDDILVLYSDRSVSANVVCTTLQAFLLRTGGSTLLVDGVVSSLLLMTRGFPGTTYNQHHKALPGLNLWFELLPSHSKRKKGQRIRVQARANNREAISLLERILVSLSCALRSPGAQISWSDARIEKRSAVSSEIILKPLEKLSNKACWTTLFDRKIVIQCNFERHNEAPSPRIPSSKGALEAPLSFYLGTNTSTGQLSGFGSDVAM